MTTKYEDVRAIALTVGEILDLQCALYDAQRYNEKANYPATAEVINKLLNKIYPQTNKWIEEADQNLTINLNAARRDNGLTPN